MKLRDMIKKPKYEAKASVTMDGSPEALAKYAEREVSTKIRDIAYRITNICEAELDLTMDEGDLVYNTVITILRHLKNYPSE